ncbi:MAG: hypothetical protein ACI8ZB_005434 [Desulforhopalus sp.]|jgi:hypothetical protein
MRRKSSLRWPILHYFFISYYVHFHTRLDVLCLDGVLSSCKCIQSPLSGMMTNSFGYHGQFSLNNRHTLRFPDLGCISLQYTLLKTCHFFQQTEAIKDTLQPVFPGRFIVLLYQHGSCYIFGHSISEQRPKEPEYIY